MLDQNAVEYTYRDYTREPLSQTEISAVLLALGLSAADVLRKRDKAYRELGLSGEEPEAVLVAHMADHPTLLQRPIGLRGDKAVVGRPPKRLFEIL